MRPHGGRDRFPVNVAAVDGGHDAQRMGSYGDVRSRFESVSAETWNDLIAVESISNVFCRTVQGRNVEFTTYPCEPGNRDDKRGFTA